MKGSTVGAGVDVNYGSPLAFHRALILSVPLSGWLRQDEVRGHQANAIICFNQIENGGMSVCAHTYVRSGVRAVTTLELQATGKWQKMLHECTSSEMMKLQYAASLLINAFSFDTWRKALPLIHPIWQ